MSADQQDQLASANEVAQVEPPQGKSQMVAKLWEEEAPEIIGEILIRAGKDVAFRLDESAQCIELEEDLATFAPTRIRTIADAVKDLIARTVPGAVRNVTVRPVFRLNPSTSLATPTLTLRFRYVDAASSAVTALESRLRHLMNLVGSDADNLFLSRVADLLPNDAAALHVVELAKQIRTAHPHQALAQGIEMTSPVFEAPVAIPARIGAAPPRDDEPLELQDATGEIVGYLRPERLVFVLLAGRRASTALTADMEAFFDIASQQAQLIGNRCKVLYEPSQGQQRLDQGKLLRVNVQLQGLLADKQFLTSAEAPELAEVQARKSSAIALDDGSCMTTQTTINS